MDVFKQLVRGNSTNRRRKSSSAAVITTSLFPQIEVPEEVATNTHVAHAEQNWPVPKLHLSIQDMAHPGTTRFLQQSGEITKFIQESIEATYEILFSKPNVPRVNSITLFLRRMDGIAYTTSSQRDGASKEIHFNTDYIANMDEETLVDEIRGVLQREIVHCFQYDGRGTCPPGLKEGIADFVRLKRGFISPHWTKIPAATWDAGHESTAYFLQRMDDIFKDGFIRKLNESMVEWYDPAVWVRLTRVPVETLWQRYLSQTTA